MMDGKSFLTKNILVWEFCPYVTEKDWRVLCWLTNWMRDVRDENVLELSRRENDVEVGGSRGGGELVGGRRLFLLGRARIERLTGLENAGLYLMAL